VPDRSVSSLVEVRRSSRRRRTISAYRDGDKIVVLLPARMSRSEESRVVAEMIERVRAREQRLSARGPRRSDAALMKRAEELSNRYLGGVARPSSIRWVGNMAHRWGSCTSTDSTIRLSDRLRSMPDWVIDYVLVHELCHLIEPAHNATFWAWVGRYPETDRARGFLEGLTYSAQLAGESPPSPLLVDGGSPSDLPPSPRGVSSGVAEPLF
jgi:predicted metal-dependent hydrolase